MIRFTVCFGTGDPLLLGNVENYSAQLLENYSPEQCQMLNEVAAGIAQLMYQRLHLKLREQLIETAKKFSL